METGSLHVHPGLIAPAGGPGPAAAPQAPRRTERATDGADEAGAPARRSIYFAYKSTEIRGEAVAVLQAHARYLARHANARVRLEGNSDERASSAYNQQLGQQRAEAVRRALLDQGVRSRQVRVVSLGETSPRSAGHDEDAWAENRRADLVYEKEE